MCIQFVPDALRRGSGAGSRHTRSGPRTGAITPWRRLRLSPVVQGCCTSRPTLEAARENDCDPAKARSGAYSASRRELDFLLRGHLMSELVDEKLSRELDAQVQEAQQAIALMQEENEGIANDEIRLARVRLIAAEKSSIQRSANQGLISMPMAERLLTEADRKLDEQIRVKEPAEGTDS